MIKWISSSIYNVAKVIVVCVIIALLGLICSLISFYSFNLILLTLGFILEGLCCFGLVMCIVILFTD
jgi:hypothetical protein